jgi:N-hydroxyarylamine O-acetyltransferase
MSTYVDLDAYFRRIGWGGPTTPTFDTLAGLLHAHTSHVPFENLDVLLHRPIRLDLAGVQAKLVRARRGGYCFEHATLFAAVLQALGFQPTAHAGRVVLFTTPADSPRTHMFLTVPVKAVTYVVDPGFGPFASPVPMPLLDGPTGQAHAMSRDGGGWTLNVPRDGHSVAGWITTLEPENPVDFEVANHYTATHPKSPFTNAIMLSAATPQGRVSVMNRAVTMLHGTSETPSETPSGTRWHLTDRVALRALLAEHFGFDLPEVEQIRVPAIPEWE